MKFLAETHDPRTQPALAKAPQGLRDGQDRRRGARRLRVDQRDGQGRGEARPDASSTSSGTSSPVPPLEDEQPAPLPGAARRHRQVKDPSYGDKAIDKLKAPVPPNPSVDSRRTSSSGGSSRAIQVISELKYTKAVKQLIVALLTPTKTATLGATSSSRSSRWRRPPSRSSSRRSTAATPTTNAREALGRQDEHRRHRRRARASSAGPAGRDAILAALPERRHRHVAHRARAGAHADAERPAHRAGVPRHVQEDALGRIGRAARRAQPAHRARAGVGQLLRPEAHADWLLKEMKGAPDYAGRAVQLEAEAKLMTPDKQDDVAGGADGAQEGDAGRRVRPGPERCATRESARSTSATTDASCYLGILDEPIPVVAADGVLQAGQGHVDGGHLRRRQRGGDARARCCRRCDKVKNTGARIALVRGHRRAGARGRRRGGRRARQDRRADTKAGRQGPHGPRTTRSRRSPGACACAPSREQAAGRGSVAMIRLDVTQGPTRGARHESSADVVRIGRAADNDVVLARRAGLGRARAHRLRRGEVPAARPALDERHGRRARRSERIALDDAHGRELALEAGDVVELGAGERGGAPGGRRSPRTTRATRASSRCARSTSSARPSRRSSATASRLRALYDVQKRIGGADGPERRPRRDLRRRLRAGAGRDARHRRAARGRRRARSSYVPIVTRVRGQRGRRRSPSRSRAASSARS